MQNFGTWKLYILQYFLGLFSPQNIFSHFCLQNLGQILHPNLTVIFFSHNPWKILQLIYVLFERYRWKCDELWLQWLLSINTVRELQYCRWNCFLHPNELIDLTVTWNWDRWSDNSLSKAWHFKGFSEDPSCPSFWRVTCVFDGQKNTIFDQIIQF